VADGAERSNWADRHLWQIRPVRDAAWIALGVFIIYMGYVLRSIFTPVLVALVLAYIFTPLVDFCRRRLRMPAVLTLALILAVLVASTLGLVLWYVPAAVAQALELVADLPGYAEVLAERYGSFLGHSGQGGEGSEAEAARELSGLERLAANLPRDPVEIAKTLIAGTSTAFGFIGSVISVTTYVLATALLIPFYFFCFAMGFHSAADRLKAYIPASGRERTMEILGKMDRAVSAFVRGRLIIAVIMGVLFAVGWWLTGVPYYLVLALLTGLLGLIPYAAGLGWLLALAIKALDLWSGAEPADSALAWVIGLGGPTLVYAFVEFLEGWILTPWIQGKSTDMAAVTVVIVVFVGGALGGLYGMLLAIPLAACGKIMLVEVVLPRMRKWAEES
jgi:predicted PurR-regulated permease PerM